ncbi:hypothetical protein [Ensifer aridi]|uniref:hypothetical protein n=1 Tax=Ensifer aridi TaxID=1708715 RepID=UPI000A0F869F|nr:hypothetical protein [Ensifer aridi]
MLLAMDVAAVLADRRTLVTQFWNCFAPGLSERMTSFLSGRTMAIDDGFVTGVVTVVSRV